MHISNVLDRHVPRYKVLQLLNFVASTYDNLTKLKKDVCQGTSFLGFPERWSSKNFVVFNTTPIHLLLLVISLLGHTNSSNKFRPSKSSRYLPQNFQHGNKNYLHCDCCVISSTYWTLWPTFNSLFVCIVRLVQFKPRQITRHLNWLHSGLENKKKDNLESAIYQ